MLELRHPLLTRFVTMLSNPDLFYPLLGEISPREREIEDEKREKVSFKPKMEDTVRQIDSRLTLHHNSFWEFTLH